MKKITLLLSLCCFALGFSQNGGDDCASAVSVLAGTITQTQINDVTPGTNTGDSAWFSYTATSDGTLFIASCLGGTDTRLFTFSDCAGTFIATDDDTCPFAADGTGNAFASALDFPVTNGATYFIEWDDRWSTDPFDWTIELITCTPGTATVAVVEDCDNDQFTLDVDFTDLGNSTTLTISTDFDATTYDVTMLGITTIGPFPKTTNVNITIAHENNTDCDLTGGPFVDNCPPDCPAPTALNVTNIAETSADLGWTENGSTTTWIVEWGPVGFVQGTGTEEVTTTNPYNLMGLTGGTDYDFYVTADCTAAGNGLSLIEGPTGFTTQDAPTELVCNDTFVDSGGDAATYSASELITYVISPDVVGDAVTITFDVVDIETNGTGEGTQDGCWDFLTIYNGPDTSSPVLAATLCGEESGDGGVPSVATSELNVGDAFTSTHPSGALTIVFQSDGSVQETGWSATVACNTLSNDAFSITSNEFKYFPNPAENVLSIRAKNEIQNVTVFNMLGQQVMTKSLNTVSEDLDISALGTGSYFVKVTINNVTETVRILKK